MNRDWKSEWGGDLALWEGTLDGLKKEGGGVKGGAAHTVSPVFNRAVLFRTSGTHE